MPYVSDEDGYGWEDPKDFIDPYCPHCGRHDDEHDDTYCHEFCREDSTP